MITHYDMTTGEVITDEHDEQPCVTTADRGALPPLRLLTVEEAAASRVETPVLPACVATLPVDLLLSRQS